MKIFDRSARKFFVLSLSVVMGILLMAGSSVLAEESPIRIRADRMISQEQENSVVFMGNVDANQGETVIQCDEMTVFYANEDKQKSSTSRVKKLICKGNVKVTNGDWLGTGKRMDYFEKEKKVILSGDAQAWQGPNMVQGETIIHYLGDKRSSVEKGTSKKNGRVEAVIQQGSGTR